jgi:hypothetical protein
VLLNINGERFAHHLGLGKEASEPRAEVPVAALREQEIFISESSAPRRCT